MKRIWSLLLALLLMACIFSGCQEDTPSLSPPESQSEADASLEEAVGELPQVESPAESPEEPELPPDGDASLLEAEGAGAGQLEVGTSEGDDPPRDSPTEPGGEDPPFPGEQNPFAQAAAAQRQVTILVVDESGDPVEGIIVEVSGQYIGETRWRGEVYWNSDHPYPPQLGVHSVTLRSVFNSGEEVEEDGVVSYNISPIEARMNVEVTELPGSVTAVWPYEKPYDTLEFPDAIAIFTVKNELGEPVPDLELSLSYEDSSGDADDMGTQFAVVLRETNGLGETYWNNPKPGEHTIYATDGVKTKSYEIKVPSGNGTTNFNLLW